MNYYSPIPDQNAELEVIKSKEAVVFSFVDQGVKRVFYCASNSGALKGLLGQVSPGSVIEVVSRDRLECADMLEQPTFEQFAVFMRVSCPDLSAGLHKRIPPELLAVEDGLYGESATISEARDVRDLLTSLFDPRTSHISSLAQVEQEIRDGRVWVYKDQNGIASLLVSLLTGKKFYINHIYNRAEREVIHSILLTRLHQAMRQGINYAYAWIEEGNQRSLAFHARYSMSPDGLMDIYYRKR